MSLRSAPVYTAHDHGAMIADHARVEPYRRALERTVKPGDIVVEIGTGSGLLAMFACRFGARQVYAIEAEGVIDLAKQIASVNGYADRITFIHAHSTSVDVPEPADVVIADIHGALPVFGRGLESLRDARSRLLKPGGAMIPRRDRIWMAAAELQEREYGRVAVWSDGRWGFDLTPGARFGVDWPFPAAVQPSHLRSESVCLASLDYAELESASVGGAVSLKVPAAGVANGYAFWFDSELADDIWLRSGPGEAVAVYPRNFAPWTRPVQLRAGDAVEADVRFVMVNNDYVWRWTTAVLDAAGDVREKFQQSSLNSMFITPAPLRRRAPQFRPQLGERGQAERMMLQLMDEGLTLDEIAHAVARRYPQVFADVAAALDAVANLSEEYSA